MILLSLSFEIDIELKIALGLSLIAFTKTSIAFNDRTISLLIDIT